MKEDETSAKNKVLRRFSEFGPPNLNALTNQTSKRDKSPSPRPSPFNTIKSQAKEKSEALRKATVKRSISASPKIREKFFPKSSSFASKREVKSMSFSSNSLPQEVEETKSIEASSNTPLHVSKSEPNLQQTNKDLERNNFSKEADENTVIDETKEHNKHEDNVEKVVELSNDFPIERVDKDTTDHADVGEINDNEKDIIEELSENNPLETEVNKETLNENENEDIETLDEKQENNSVLQEKDKLEMDNSHKEVFFTVTLKVLLFVFNLNLNINYNLNYDFLLNCKIKEFFQYGFKTD